MKKRKIFVFSKEDICFSGKRYFFGKKKKDIFLRFGEKGKEGAFSKDGGKKEVFFLERKRKRRVFFQG